MKKKIKNMKYGAAGVLLGILAGIIMVLTGCGGNEEENIKTEEERIVESIDENGNVLEVTENEQSTEPEEEISEEEISDREIADQEERLVEVLDVDKDYLEYMTGDELKALAAEALKEAGYDARLAEGKLKTKGISFDLPEGFEENPDVKGMYITGRYPIDATNIYYSEGSVDYTLQLMKEDYFAELIQNSYADAGVDAQVSIQQFDQIKINGVPTFRIVAKSDCQDNQLTQLIYLINGSKTYTLIYTETSDYDRMEWFEASAETIKVNR